ncbi:MAG: MlaE family ABC transporter permease [Flavobacteriales bacterium]|jgi:phospholipid/cholesterol/gamma-HCH transport system permease protein
MTLFNHIGKYFMLMRSAMRRPEKWGLLLRMTIQEIDKIGIQSVGIVSLLALFMGAVICLQTAAQIDSGWIPLYTIGFTVRQTMILEFAPTMIPVIMAGKVGSNISSEIGTMRISEQIDALDIMGVNSAGYLILPKIIGAVVIFPFLIIGGMFLGIAAGAMIGEIGGVISFADYEVGIQYDFRPFQVAYALIKTTVFAFIIVTVSAYTGYYTRGGALEVGRASTQAVVYSIVLIMITNLVLTELLLT